MKQWIQCANSAWSVSHHDQSNTVVIWASPLTLPNWHRLLVFSAIEPTKTTLTANDFRIQLQFHLLNKLITVSNMRFRHVALCKWDGYYPRRITQRLTARPNLIGWRRSGARQWVGAGSDAEDHLLMSRQRLVNCVWNLNSCVLSSAVRNGFKGIIFWWNIMYWKNTIFCLMGSSK